MHDIVSETFDISWYSYTWYFRWYLIGWGSNFAVSHWLWWSPLQHSHTTVWACDSCVLVLGYVFQLFYNYRRSIQLSSLPWLVFCRCFKKNCTLHCDVIYFQTIYIYLVLQFHVRHFQSTPYDLKMSAVTGRKNCTNFQAIFKRFILL